MLAQTVATFLKTKLMFHFNSIYNYPDIHSFYIIWLFLRLVSQVWNQKSRCLLIYRNFCYPRSSISDLKGLSPHNDRFKSWSSPSLPTNRCLHYRLRRIFFRALHNLVNRGWYQALPRVSLKQLVSIMVGLCLQFCCLQNALCFQTCTSAHIT